MPAADSTGTRAAPEAAVTWEIRRDGRAVVRSPEPFCGYSRDTLAQMKRCGLRLFKDGKMQR